MCAQDVVCHLIRVALPVLRGVIDIRVIRVIAFNRVIRVIRAVRLVIIASNAIKLLLRFSFTIISLVSPRPRLSPHFHTAPTAVVLNHIQT
jgi:hypothetical protein